LASTFCCSNAENVQAEGPDGLTFGGLSGNYAARPLFFHVCAKTDHADGSGACTAFAPYGPIVVEASSWRQVPPAPCTEDSSEVGSCTPEVMRPLAYTVTVEPSGGGGGGGGHAFNLSGEYLHTGGFNNVEWSKGPLPACHHAYTRVDRSTDPPAAPVYLFWETSHEFSRHRVGLSCPDGAWIVAKAPGAIVGRALYSELAVACGGYRDGPQENAHTAHDASALGLRWSLNGAYGTGYSWGSAGDVHVRAHCLGEGTPCAWDGDGELAAACEKTLPWSQTDQRQRVRYAIFGPPVAVAVDGTRASRNTGAGGDNGIDHNTN
jgi:hypothetical protein